MKERQASRCAVNRSVANDTPTSASNVVAMTDPAHVDHDEIDLDTIATELAGVDAALDRLAEGTYWTDEVTGEPIPDDVLAADPIARRA